MRPSSRNVSMPVVARSVPFNENVTADVPAAVRAAVSLLPDRVTARMSVPVPPVKVAGRSVVRLSVMRSSPSPPS